MVEEWGGCCGGWKRRGVPDLLSAMPLFVVSPTICLGIAVGSTMKDGGSGGCRRGMNALSTPRRRRSALAGQATRGIPQQVEKCPQPRGPLLWQSRGSGPLPPIRVASTGTGLLSILIHALIIIILSMSLTSCVSCQKNKICIYM